MVIDPVNFTGVGASPIISTNSSFSPNTVTVKNGAHLTISANLTTAEDMEVVEASSSVSVLNGTLRVGPNNGGRLIMDLGGDLTIFGGQVIVDERLITGEGSHTYIQGGNVSSGDRFLLDAGGNVVQSAGNVTVGATFAMADGNAIQSCHYLMTGGTLTINGEMAFENEAGNYTPTFEMRGGSLILNGQMSWFGEAPGTGTPKFIMSGGIAHINGDILHLPASTVNLHIALSGTADFNFNGATIDANRTNDSIRQSGDANFSLTNACLWRNHGVFWAEGVTTNFRGAGVLNGSGQFQFASVHIQPNKSLVHTAPAEIFVSGYFIKDGTFTPNQNTVVLNGNAMQQLQGTSTFYLYNLRLENTSQGGVMLDIPTQVMGHLQLNRGRLFSFDAQSLTLQDNATASSGSELSFVHGPMRKRGDDAFVFPIGKGNQWRRLGISAPQGTSSILEAEYFDASSTPLTPVDSPLTAVSSLEHWTLDRLAGNTPLRVSLFWEDALGSSITDCNDLYLAHWTGNTWEAEPATVSGGCSTGTSGEIISDVGLGNLGTFTFGFEGLRTTQQIQLCAGETLTVGNNTYQTTGTYIDVLTATNNEDSTVITHLQILPINISNLSANLCFGESYTVGGNTYSTSGTYSDTLTAAAGCDSIVNLQLTIQPQIATNQTLHLCAGESLTIGSNTYTQAGTYTDTLFTGLGCDSILTTVLTFASPIDTTLTQNGPTLTANATTGTYQWMDCTTGQPVPNATSQSFTPTQSGLYNVVITESSCTASSSCVAVTIVSREDEIAHQGLKILPNPSTGPVKISWDQQLGVVDLAVYSLQGEKLLELNKVESKTTFLDLSSLSAGMYLVQISGMGGLLRGTLVVGPGL